ncbi:hypothetical protein ACOSQ3_014825 [Xanthoceras sorbifolium]
MVKKLTIRDHVRDVTDSNNKSFEELEGEVKRHASDEAEAHKLLKESIMYGVVSRLFHDAQSERLKKNLKEEKEESLKKNQEEIDFFALKKKRVTFTISDDVPSQFHDEKKCNSSEEKGTSTMSVEVRNPKKKTLHNFMLEQESKLKKQKETVNVCVPMKERVRITEKGVKICDATQFHDNEKRSNNNNHNKDKGMVKVNNKPKKKTIATKKKFTDVGIDPPPDMPNNLRKYIEERGGSEIKLVIMKQLYFADLIPRNNRISMPNNQIRDDSVLTEEEKKFIIKKNHDDADDKFKPGLVVTLIEYPSMQEYEQQLKTWNMSSDTYVLTNNWNSVVKRHNHVLKVGTLVQLWSFRRQQATSSSSSSSPQKQSDRFFTRKRTPLMQTNLSFVLVVVDGKGNEEDGGASTSYECGDTKRTASADSAVTEGGEQVYGS